MEKRKRQKLMHSLQLDRLNLRYVEDIDVISLNSRRTRTEQFVDYDINIMFKYGVKPIKIRLDKLKEFDKEINADMDFDEIKKRLDCCRGLNWLANNSEM